VVSHQVGVCQHTYMIVECLIGIIYAYMRAMNTPSIIAGPSVIHLQPHVGRFLAQMAGNQAMFGHKVGV